MDLVRKFESSPWPDQDTQRVVFILDARNQFEQDILEKWVAHFAPADATSEQVVVVLGDDRKGIDSTFLKAALSTADAAIVAPLRMTWLPPASFDILRFAFQLCEVSYEVTRFTNSRLRVY